MVDAPGRSNLIGRRVERRVLADVIAGASAGRGGLAVVSGEAGIGKSTVAADAATVARSLGLDVGWAACWQTAAVPALWPWTQALARLPGGRPLPDLAIGSGGAEEGAAVQADRVERWLRAATHPLLVVLEDLHWADAATVAVLGHLTGSLPTLPVAVVVTSRPMAAGPTADALARLRRRGAALELAGLDTAETAELAAREVGMPIGAELAMQLRAVTGGNPLFCAELLRRWPAGGVQCADELLRDGVPASVTDVVAERVSALGPVCRRVLDALALGGDELALDVLTAVVGIDAAAVLAAMDEARRAGLADLDAHGARFAHALFRAAVGEAVTLPERVRLHDRIGRRLLARRDGGGLVASAALAHHFGRSVPAGNTALAYRFAVEAAGDAEAMAAFDLAAARWEQARRLLDVDPALGHLTEVLLHLADAEAAMGLPGARATYAQAVAAARAGGDAVALGRAALGVSGGTVGLEVVVGDPAVCALLVEAADLLADDGVVGPLVEARWAVASSYLVPLADRTAAADRARRRAEAAGDPATMAATVAVWCNMVAGPDAVDQRRAAAERLVGSAIASGDHANELLGRRLLVEALFERGDLAAVTAEANRYRAVAQRTGRRDVDWYPALWLAAVALARGDDDGHRAARAELAERVDGHGGANAALLAAVHDVADAMDRDDRPAGHAAMARILPDAPTDAVQLQATLARLTHAGAPGPTRPVSTLVDEALAADRDSEWLPTLAQLLEVVGAGGTDEAAARIITALEPFADVWVVEGIGAATRGPVARFLAPALARLGRRTEAAAQALAAEQALVAAGAHHLAALTRAEALAAGIEPSSGPLPPATHTQGGGSHAATGTAGMANRFIRTGETYVLSYRGVTSTLRASKGLGDLAALLARPGEEVPVLELASVAGMVAQGGTGDAVDATARDAYRRRLVAIDGELDEADRHGDAARSRALADERDALLRELSAAFGRHGRARPSGASAERARTAVRSRIRDALRRIEAVDPVLARHLSGSVRTGTYCVYDPEAPTPWEA